MSASSRKARSKGPEPAFRRVSSSSRGSIRLPEFEHKPRRMDFLQVFVRDNNVDQALRALKKKMQREGIFREMKRRRSYEKPSEKKTREKAEAIRRARKTARKQAQRDGLLPPPKEKRTPAGAPRGGRPFPAGMTVNR